MVNTVHSENFSRIVVWINESVLKEFLNCVIHSFNFHAFFAYFGSTLAVASSKTRIELLRRIALARHT